MDEYPISKTEVYREPIVFKVRDFKDIPSQHINIIVPEPIAQDVSFWDQLGMVWNVMKKMPKIIWLLYQIVQLADGVKNMTIDKKTTISTVVAIIATILGLFGKAMAPELQSMITDAIYVVWMAVIAIIGWYSGKPDKEEKAEK